MQYKCETCHDSGSTNYSGEYLNCPDCDLPIVRRDLNAFVKSLGPTHPEDVALAIHQRALAMAPKQEAPSRKLDDMELNHAFDYVTKPWAYVRNEDISRSRAYFKAGYKYAFESAPHSQMSSADHAAPAAANGALTDEKIDAAWDSLPGANIIQGQNSMNWNSLIRRAFARAILAAAGPDAALIKALESALAIINNEADPDEYAAPLKLIRAAISGAKGN